MICDKLLQTTQPTSSGAITNCCAEKPPAPRNGGLIAAFGQASYADPLLLIKVSDVETNLGSTTTHKQVWICNICHK